MSFVKKTLAIVTLFALSACALTPQQQAEREAKRIKASQALAVQLAGQCDAEAATLMQQQFNPPLSQTAQEKAAFEKRYAQKLNDPMFKACYKMAQENYKTQQELEEMRYRYYDDRPWFGPWRFCHLCL